MIDLATLTGAARVALGPELPAVFGTRQATVDALLRHGRRVADPLWHMPLWGGYDDDLASKVADLNNVSASAFAGAIIGALFLRRFVDARPRTGCTSTSSPGIRKERPGRPVGARSAGGARAVRDAGGALRAEREPHAMDLGFERRAWTLVYLCLGLVEGGTAAVMVRALFGDQAPPHGWSIWCWRWSARRRPGRTSRAWRMRGGRRAGRRSLSCMPLLLAMCVCVAALALRAARAGPGCCCSSLLYAARASAVGRRRDGARGALERELPDAPARAHHRPDHRQYLDRARRASACASAGCSARQGPGGASRSWSARALRPRRRASRSADSACGASRTCSRPNAHALACGRDLRPARHARHCWRAITSFRDYQYAMSLFGAGNLSLTPLLIVCLDEVLQPAGVRAGAGHDGTAGARDAARDPALGALPRPASRARVPRRARPGARRRRSLCWWRPCCCTCRGCCWPGAC